MFIHKGVYAQTSYTVTYEKGYEVLPRNHVRVGLPSEYMSTLVARTYDGVFDSVRPAILQSLCDAMSPFQVLSKTWAHQVLQTLIQSQKEYAETNVIYVGSWFGQQAMRDIALLNRMVLIDQDPMAYELALRAMMSVSAVVPVTHINKDVFALETLPYHNGQNVVVWTGVEHFDEYEIMHCLRKAPSGTTFLFMGTNMPAPDHKRLYYRPKDVESLGTHVSCETLALGTLTTDIGSRYLAVLRRT